MSTPPTMHVPSHGARPVIIFDRRVESVPYQQLDAVTTLSVSAIPSPKPQGRVMVLKIDPQRMAEALATQANK